MRRVEVENILNSEYNIYSSEELTCRYFPRSLHVHSEFEIILIQSGEGVCFAGNGVTSFSSGDIFIFHGDLPHFFNSSNAYYRDDCEDLSISLFVQFKESVLPAESQNISVLSSINKLLSQSEFGLKWSASSGEKVMIEGELLSQQIRSLHNLEGISRLTKFYETLDMLSGELHNAERISSDKKAYSNFSDDTVYRKVLEYISLHFQRQITLTEIADHCGMNSSALCRYFKRLSGESIFNIISDFRISYAKSQLSTTDLYISTIAYESGFGSLARFNHQFRTAVGSTPSEYRAHLRK